MVYLNLITMFTITMFTRITRVPMHQHQSSPEFPTFCYVPLQLQVGFGARTLPRLGLSSLQGGWCYKQDPGK